MNNTKRRAHVAATAVLCALVVTLAIGVIAQQLAASRLSADIKGQKQLLAKSKGELKDRAKWRNDYGDLSLKLGGRMSACSWSDQMPFMVAQVSGIVEANGLKVENLQPEPMTSSGSVQRFPMRLVLQTDLKHLTELLKDITGSSPLLDVERLEVRNAQGDTGKLQVNLTVASFVVIDRNSLLGRRRAVVPTKTNATKPAAQTTEKPADKPAVKTTEKPVPTAAPVVHSAPGPEARAEHSAPQAMPHPSSSPADWKEVEVGGRKIKVPPGADPEMIRKLQERTNGGAK